jgi:DhnA family fructose-bisphosphate aldolase class Ia
MEGRDIRIKRLFGGSRAIVVAIDHGLFMGALPGMEDLVATAGKINPEISGVLLAPGMLRHCHAVFAGRNRPQAIVRLNWNSIYCFPWGYSQARSVESCQPEDALASGMDIALVSLTLNTGDEDRDASNVAVFSKLMHACHRLGIPVIGEYFPAGFATMSPDELHEDVRIGSRILCELGADAIKTFNTQDFRAVTASCPVPVFGLGADKLPTQLDALQLAAAEVAAGAGGVVFGRNAVQVPDPFAFQAALCDVVRREADPQEMVQKYNLQ